MQLDKTALVLVPCFSGAPWDTDAFPRWQNRPIVTGPFNNHGRIEDYADVVEGWTRGLDEYVLVGDSFGALVTLSLASKQPKGLKALVISGGFARPHVSWLTKLQIRLASLLGQVGYGLTVRGWVKGLGSHFDPPGTGAKLEELFHGYSDARTFVDRARAVFATDLRETLPRINVPVFILTPEDDRLIGVEAVTEMLEGLPDAEEQVLAGTGHLLRFTHPEAYAEAVDEFLTRHLSASPRLVAAI